MAETQRSPHGQQNRVFRFENVVIFKDKDSQLGVGSYGAVYRAKCDQLPCAAKILHPALFQTNDPGSHRILERFEQECGFLSSIRHPNIVQYLGLCRDHDSGLPVLLMELLDSSLTKYLETSNKPLPYHVQVDLCFDIALAIAYLHSNDIIHRDLSGNNVLILAGSRAKVTDFGMSKLADVSSCITRRTLTHCPGTEVYMPPEALKEPPLYTKKLDCFSFGALVIQMVTRLFPSPGPRTREISSPLSPTGLIEVPVMDTERRKPQIDVIDPTHPLLPVATQCLQYNQEDRPSAQQLCEQLATLKEAPQYSESKQHVQEHEESTTPVENDMLENDRSIRELQQENKELAKQLEEKDHVIKEKNRVITELQHTLAHTLAQKEKQESLLAGDSDACINDFTCKLQIQQQTTEQPQAKVDSKMVEKNSNELSWRDGGKAPQMMHYGSCTVDGDIAYFRGPTTDIYAHIGKWDSLPQYPEVRYFTMVVVNGLLTGIGGFSDTFSKKLFSLVGEEKRRKWVEKLPRMPTRRANTAAVCSGKILVVAGGYSAYGEKLKTVELLDIDSQQWYIARELPHRISEASATVCGDNLYLICGYNKNGDPSRYVFTCSLSALVRTARPATPMGKMKKAFSHEQVWSEVASPPVTLSTCATLNGQVVAVGGRLFDERRSNSVYAYEPTTNRWDVISTMPTARSRCLVVVLPRNEMMVVGGSISSGGNTDKIEVATF